MATKRPEIKRDIVNLYIKHTPFDKVLHMNEHFIMWSELPHILSAMVKNCCVLRYSRSQGHRQAGRAFARQAAVYDHYSQQEMQQSDHMLQMFFM